MTRLFFKTLLNFFLWLILLINLVMFFQVPSMFDSGYIYEGTYFGVSGLINAFKSMGDTPLATFTLKIHDFYKNVAKTFNELWSNTVLNLPKNLSQTWDEDMKLVALFKSIWEVLKVIFMSITSIIGFLFNGFVFMFYCLAMIINLFWFLINLLGYSTITPLPQSFFKKVILELVNSPHLAI